MVDVTTLTDQELINLYHKELELAEELDVKQHSNKILINALYGAMSNRYFILVNFDIANAITANGRFYVRLFSERVSRFLKQFDDTDTEHIAYNDTDSVTGDTEIIVNGQKTTIAEFFDYVFMAHSEVIETNKDKEVVKLPFNYKTPSINVIGEKQLQDNNITYAYKHKVKKEFYKVTANGSEVVMTADHSLMVLRDNQIIAIKPNEVRKGDKLVILKE